MRPAIMPIMITEKQVWAQLKTVLDPELHINIVDLGLIYSVTLKSVDEQPFVDIVMTLTTPGCPLAGTIQTMIRDALYVFDKEGLDVDQNVSVEITFDPPWSIECMSEEVRAELGFD